MGTIMTEHRESNSNLFPIARSLLTIHALYNLPPEIQQLDPKEKLIEIVIWPVVKYDYQERRITHIPLSKSILQFSPSLILFKNNQYILDFNNNITLNSSNIYTEKQNISHDLIVQWWKSRSRWNIINDNNNNNNNENNSNNNNNNNQILLEYPCPIGLKTHIDIIIGIRERRIGSSTVRWITTGLGKNGPTEGIGYFSVSLEEIYRKKILTRIIGLNIGGALFSISVNPNDNKDIIFSRLMADKKRFLSKGNKNLNLEKMDLTLMLQNGFSEEEIYKQMLLVIDPNYYLRRLENLFMLYPLNINEEWKQVNLLMHMYSSKEEELLRRAIIEIGPECQNVSSRHRLLAYRKKYLLSDQNILTCLHSTIGENIYDILITEPEVIFEVLTKKFGIEPQPTSYLFPLQNYKEDKRVFFLETLHFVSNCYKEKHKDIHISSYNIRLPFILSPCEQPLHVEISTLYPHESINEIEFFCKKYASEFVQIIPFIVNALQIIVKKNRKIHLSKYVDNNFLIFQQKEHQSEFIYYDFIQRIADHTFISPSSMLGAIIYLDRLCLRHSNLIITEHNIIRLFLTSVRVASKIFELRSINNSRFAEIFELNTKTINLLEETFIKILQFDLFVSLEEFEKYVQALLLPDVYKRRILALQRNHEETEGKTCGILPHMLSNTESIGKNSSEDSAIIGDSGSANITLSGDSQLNL